MTDQSFCGTCGKPTIDSEYVTLSRAEYKTLLEGASKAVQRPILSNRFRWLSNSPIARDIEMAEFIFECSKTMIIREVKQACINKYGEKKRHQTVLFKDLSL